MKKKRESVTVCPECYKLLSQGPGLTLNCPAHDKRGQGLPGYMVAPGLAVIHRGRADWSLTHLNSGARAAVAPNDKLLVELAEWFTSKGLDFTFRDTRDLPKETSQAMYRARQEFLESKPFGTVLL